MAYSGDINLWAEQFPKDQIPRVLRLILESWNSFEIPSERLEVPITRKFCAHLQRNKDRSVHSFRIDWESYVLNEEGELLGRIDLRFSQGLDENVYFSIECKRLRVQHSSRFDTLAREYVTEGMVRYFNGQYAGGLDCGGMLGYVMDGETDQAIDDVRKAMEQRRFDLYMAEDDTLSSSSALSSRQVRETLHNYGPDNRFALYHVFLPIEQLDA